MVDIMVGMFGFLSLGGLFVCALIITMKAIRAEPLKPSVTGFLVCLVVFTVFFAIPAKSKKQETGTEQVKGTESIAQDNKKADFTEETPASIKDKTDKADAEEDDPVKEGSIAEETPKPENESVAEAVEYDALQKRI